MPCCNAVMLLCQLTQDLQPALLQCSPMDTRTLLRGPWVETPVGFSGTPSNNSSSAFTYGNPTNVLGTTREKLGNTPKSTRGNPGNASWNNRGNASEANHGNPSYATGTKRGNPDIAWGRGHPKENRHSCTSPTMLFVEWRFSNQNIENPKKRSFTAPYEVTSETEAPVVIFDVYIRNKSF